MIEEGILEYIQNMKEVGITVTGLVGEKKDEIEVVIQAE
jgi:hypothetical protein